MWTVSAIQLHPKGLIVCDEDATLELHVKVTSGISAIGLMNWWLMHVVLDCQIL